MRLLDDRYAKEGGMEDREQTGGGETATVRRPEVSGASGLSDGVVREFSGLMGADEAAQDQATPDDVPLH